MSPRTTSEADFLAAYDLRDYPPFAVTVDIALFTLIDSRLSVLLIRRAAHPYLGAWALPGGFVRDTESIDQAAARELNEETNVRFDGHLEQLKTYGDPGRDPRGRVVSVAHLAITPAPPAAAAGSDAALARYWPIHELGIARGQRAGPELAFDHREILRDALERVRAKLEYTPLATTFLKTPFTIAELRQVYETVWDAKLDPGNFQRKILNTTGLVEATDDIAPSTSSGGRPARLYKPGSANTLSPPLLRAHTS